jgi:hypothetical protein
MVALTSQVEIMLVYRTVLSVLRCRKLMLNTAPKFPSQILPLLLLKLLWDGLLIVTRLRIKLLKMILFFIILEKTS